MRIPKNERLKNFISDNGELPNNICDLVSNITFSSFVLFLRIIILFIFYISPFILIYHIDKIHGALIPYFVALWFLYGTLVKEFNLYPSFLNKLCKPIKWED